MRTKKTIRRVFRVFSILYLYPFKRPLVDSLSAGEAIVNTLTVAIEVMLWGLVPAIFARTLYGIGLGIFASTTLGYIFGYPLSYGLSVICIRLLNASYVWYIDLPEDEKEKSKNEVKLKNDLHTVVNGVEYELLDDTHLSSRE